MKLFVTPKIDSDESISVLILIGAGQAFSAGGNVKHMQQREGTFGGTECDNSIHFNRFLIVQLNERLGQFIGMMQHERLLDPDARLARCLASLFNPVLYPENNLELKISQEEIGLLAGISWQRVNQALRKLEEPGLLHIDYGSINILDLAGLRCFGEQVEQERNASSRGHQGHKVTPGYSGIFRV
jgi:hypothetical protein